MSKAKYGADHRRIRRAWLPYAWGKPCARCGKPMARGEALHLDHADDGRSYIGFSHAKCNTSAGGRLGKLRKRGAMFIGDISLGIEASQDRKHVSVVQCGEQQRKGKTILVVCLSHYMDGDSAVVETVTALSPVAVGIDAMGPARHLIDDLEDAEVRAVFPSGQELADAQADFIAKVERRELFITGGRELDAAVQHSHLRVGEGIPRLSRSGPADVSPLNAAALALWAHGKTPVEPWAVWAD